MMQGCQCSDVFLVQAPELDSLVIGSEQTMGGGGRGAPTYLADLFFNLHALEVVEFGMVRLELGPKAELRRGGMGLTGLEAVTGVREGL